MRRFFRTATAAFAVALASAQQPRVGINTAWLPITPAEQQLSIPIVEKTAGVEALFWRVHVIDEIVGGRDLQRVMYHYVRLKVFNESGKQSASTLELLWDEDSTVTSIAGRTVKQDGTILELRKEAIHERDAVRIGRLRRKVTSFAMPGVEPGAIIEYRWKEIQSNPRFKYARLQFQREFPVHAVTYLVKPLSDDLVQMPTLSLWPFNCDPSPLKLDNQGFNVTVVQNVPAFKEEPMMPAEPNVRAWGLLFYHDGKKRSQDEYWEDLGKRKYNELKRTLKITNDVKKASAEALAGAKEGEQMPSLLRYLRKNIRGLFDSDVTDAERADVINKLSKPNGRTSDEVLKSRIATPSELNVLFAAMATHAGLEVRPALVGDRGGILFGPSMTEEYFLPNVDMAVKQGDEWKLYDAASRRLPPNMVSWREEGMPALLSDPKKPQFIKSPLSPPEASVTKRVAQLELAADGTLAGDVEESYTGHSAAERRLEFIRESDDRRKESVLADIQKIFAAASVSNIRVENADDPELPLTLRYRVSIPGYAQATGKRLFFAPLFFQRGSLPLFNSEDRKYDVHFPYAWKEADDVRIKLPEGFALDSADNPGGLELGAAGGYKLSMAVTPTGELLCSRELVFGKGGHIVYNKQMYPQLKAAFDQIHSRDSHTLALKRP